jgi:hypothetical protein
VAPPSPSVPTTTVMRSATPACSKMRRAMPALSALNSMEWMCALGATRAMRSAL